MGGLGNEPEPDNENDPLLRLKHSLEESKTKVNKIQFFKNKEPDNKEEYALNFDPENLTNKHFIPMSFKRRSQGSYDFNAGTSKKEFFKLINFLNSYN